MASNLTNQVRNIAEVARAVADGDLSRKITVDARGEVLDLKKTINAMVDQLNAFGAEVTRVAREVGVEGKLGGQATVEGVAGYLEGADRQREPDGVEPDQPGARHRRGDDGRRPRRPHPQDHGRREGRDPRAQEHHQHDGRPALVVRRGGDAPRQRRRHRGQARRPGRRPRRLGHVARPDRRRELDGDQPDRSGAQHRRRSRRDRRRRPAQEDRRSTRAARSSSSRTRSTRWWISSARSPRR